MFPHAVQLGDAGPLAYGPVSTNIELGLVRLDSTGAMDPLTDQEFTAYMDGLGYMVLNDSQYIPSRQSSIAEGQAIKDRCASLGIRSPRFGIASRPDLLAFAHFATSGSPAGSGFSGGYSGGANVGPYFDISTFSERPAGMLIPTELFYDPSNGVDCREKPVQAVPCGSAADVYNHIRDRLAGTPYGNPPIAGRYEFQNEGILPFPETLLYQPQLLHTESPKRFHYGFHVMNFAQEGWQDAFTLFQAKTIQAYPLLTVYHHHFSKPTNYCRPGTGREPDQSLPPIAGNYCTTNRNLLDWLAWIDDIPFPAGCVKDPQHSWSALTNGSLYGTTGFMDNGSLGGLITPTMISGDHAFFGFARRFVADIEITQKARAHGLKLTFDLNNSGDGYFNGDDRFRDFVNGMKSVMAGGSVTPTATNEEAIAATEALLIPLIESSEMGVFSAGMLNRVIPATSIGWSQNLKDAILDHDDMHIGPQKENLT